MFLYATILLIENKPVRYEVSAQGKNKHLVYKPERSFRKIGDLPSFWITRQNGRWMPINVKDKQLINQVVNDITDHKIV